MKHKLLISILLIFIMLTVQYCDAEGIINLCLLIIGILFGSQNAAEEGVHIDPPVPHVQQDNDIHCVPACVDMIGRWDGYKVDYTPMQIDIINWADDPTNGGDNNGLLSVNEIENAVMHFAYPTCYHSTFPGDTGYNKSIDDALTLSMSQIGESNVPNIMIVDWLSTYNLSHAILIQGYDGKELDNGVANIQSVSINDPNFSDPDDTYSIIRLRERMKTFWWNAPGGRYCLGYFLKPINSATAQAIYYDFLRNCGTYYGGPEIYSPAGTPYLRVRYPNGGNVLAHQKNYQITWEYEDVAGNIRLELFKDGNFRGTIANNIPVGNEIYNWQVGEYLDGNEQTGEGYMIKISMMDNSHEDCSNLKFSIGSMDISSPNGGESWEQESVHVITWDSSYFDGNVNLLLNKTITGTDYMIEENIPNTGTYNWLVCMCSHIDERGLIMPADCYKIKVVSVDNPDLMDASDQVFSIVAPQPTITVISPNGGEAWEINSTHPITWSANALSNNIKLTLWKDGAWLGQIVYDVIPALGMFSWTVGQHSEGVALPGHQYSIKIKEIGTDIYDFSDGTFTIKGIIITSPNGGEEWSSGTLRLISWDAPGVTGDLKITLWKDGAWIGQVAYGVNSSTGSFPWTVGQHSEGTALPGTGYQVKIKEIGTEIEDFSDNSFSIISL